MKGGSVCLGYDLENLHAPDLHYLLASLKAPSSFRNGFHGWFLSVAGHSVD